MAEVIGGRITKITDNPLKTQWMKGCARGYNAAKLTYHPERLLKPLMRTGPDATLKECSWDDALDFTAEKLLEIKDSYGPEAVIRLGGSGSCRGALHNTSTLAKRFLNLFGGYTETTGSYSSAAVSFATPFVYGTSNAAIDAGTLTYSELIILWGANIAETRFGPALLSRLKEAGSRGVRIIVVDPRKSRTVRSLDAEWVRIKPGTDSAMMAAVICELDKRKALDYEYIEKYCSGFEEFNSWLKLAPVKNAQWASDICGTEVSDIIRIVDAYSQSHPVALIPGLSIQRTLGGEDAARLAMVLQSVTGNTGIKGGSSGANIWGPMPHPRCGKLGQLPEDYAVAAQPIRKRLIPVYTWADRILDDSLSPPIRAAYNCGGNYLVQGADTLRSRRAFKSLDFSVTHDLFMTPTAAESSVVLPAADFTERSDIVFPEGNFLLYSAKAVEPPSGVKTDYEIFTLLSERLGFKEEFTGGRDETGWLRHFMQNSEISDPEEFMSRGIFYGNEHERVGLSEFVKDPEANPLQTPSGKIEICSAPYEKAGGSPFPVYTDFKEEGMFSLITPHSFLKINSQFANVPSMTDRNSGILINSSDAAALNISDGKPVILSRNEAKIRIKARLTDDIISGTLCLEAGTWPDISADMCTDTAGCPNMLTSSEPTMPSGGARTHSTFVKIEREA